MYKKKNYAKKKPAKKFIDALELLSALDKNVVIKTSFGNLDPNNLTEADLKKHGAIYVSLTNMPEFFSNKKFQSNEPSKPFKSALEHCSIYKDIIPIGSFITAELMGIQNHSYTKSDSIYVILHGAIIANSPKDLSYENLELLCESFKNEGFVIVDDSGNRSKLKREYFPDSNNPTKQRGKHCTEFDESDYTDFGFSLCGDGKYGYHHACRENFINNPTVIAEKNGFELVALPHYQAIQNQLQNPFDGEKMFGLIETIGSGDSYIYTDKIISQLTDVRFELKLDGETVLLHTDSDGNLHLLIKFQVNVHEVKQDDGSQKFRFGWF